VADRAPGAPSVQGRQGSVPAGASRDGIGGGTVGVTILTAFGAPKRAAVATASAFGIILAVPAEAVHAATGGSINRRR
jgi:uncharacterized membrane protein YfcA